MESRTVPLGDRQIPVEEPNIYKTELLGDRIATIGKQVPGLQVKMADFVSKYEKANVTEIDRATAEYQLGSEARERLQNISEDAWKARGQVLRLPRSPSGVEIAAEMLPVVWNAARDAVLDMAAILITPASQLENEGQIDRTLKEQKQFLRHKVKPSQLLPLLAETMEVIKEVIDQHKDEVGKLRSFWADVTKDEEPQNEHEAALAEVKAVVGMSGESESSIVSPRDTDGATETSSTEFPSETPSTSSVS